MTLPMPLYSEGNLSADDNIGNHRTTQSSQPAISITSVSKSVERVDPGPISRYPAAESFAERQIIHFAMVLGRKWACTEPGHEMCYTGQGKHVPLTDDMIMAWVTALCKGEATTSIPPFALSEESGSDSDTQQQHRPYQSSQISQISDDSVLTPSMSASSMGHLEMTSISNRAAAPPTASSSLFPTAFQPSRSLKTIKKYPSSSRISAISSTASQVSRISSISSSSWHSAATGMASLGSTAATSTSQSEDVTPYAPSSQGGSTVKISGPYSPDSEYSSTSRSSLSSAASPSQRFRQPPSPRLSLPHPLSPPPVSALPSPPGHLMPNYSSSTRPDSPVHSLNSEFSERLSISLQQLQQQRQPSPRHHPHRQQSLASPPSSSHHPDYPSSQSPLPPRPPRNQNRPHSPEITMRHLEQPRTPPRTPPQTPSVLQPTHATPPQITPTSSGRSFNGLRLPFSRSHTYPSPTPTSAPSASSSHSPHIHSPHLYPSQATQLMYVREEEERLVLEPESVSHRRDANAAHGNADIEDEGEPDYSTRSHADDHSFIHEQHPIRRGSDGRSDIASHVGVHDDSDQGSYVGSEAPHAHGGRSIWSPYTSFLPSLVTAPGGGNTHPPSITSTVKIKWIESAALTKRAKNHLSRIKKWRKRAITVVVDGRYSKRGKEGAQVGNLERSAVIEMIGDGVEMARSCYPPRIHKLGYELGKEIQQWLQTFTDNDPAILYKKENISLLTTIQTCFLPILLMRIAELEPPAVTLANNLIVSLTKVPLSLHENEIQSQTETGAPLFTSPPAKSNRGRPSSSGSRSLPSSNSAPLVPHHRTTSISSIAIHLVSQELGSGSPTCPSQHSWLGMSLLKIVEMSMKIRHISIGEMDDIRAVARKREEDHPHDSTSFPALIDARFTRPWEIALFALCATADMPGASFFRRMVLGTMGIPVFIRSLDSLLSVKIDMDDVKWEDVGLTLRALAFVSEQAWVVQGMSSGSEGKSDKVEAIIKAIMGVFWRDIPERWFSIRFWAMDAVRNITSHRPPLVRLLADIKADQAFITLTPTSSLYPSAINTTRMINEAGEKVRNKMLEEYRKESAKRAQEMVDYIRMFHGVDEGKMNTGKHVVLQPVSIGFDGR